MSAVDLDCGDAERVAAGATVLAEHAGHHIVPADPEGDEFCVA